MLIRKKFKELNMLVDHNEKNFMKRWVVGM
jgi:hypothetical protein